MAYDPADIRLPPQLSRLLDRIEAAQLPLAPGWSIGVTRPGAIFSSALLGVWAAALYSGNNLLYLCGAMLLALTLIALTQSILLLRSAPLFSPLLPAWCQAKTACLIRQPTTAKPPCHGVVTIRWSQLPEAAIWRCDNQQQRLLAQWQPQRRQRLPLTQQQLTTSAPLGLWNITRRRSDPGDWVVMPPIVAMPQNMRAASHLGATTVPQAGHEEFHGLRHYAAGDSPTRIHWRKAGSDSRDWRSKLFAAAQAHISAAHLVVDLRLPTNGHRERFEQLLGQAWGWLRDAPNNASITLGNRHFLLPQQRQQAILALAAAQPEPHAPQRLDGAGLLSLIR